MAAERTTADPSRFGHVNPNLLVMSIADWDRPLWTNKQHLACRLNDHLGRLTYLNSLSLRRPSLTRSDAARALGKLRTGGRVASTVDVPSGISVIQPYALPFHRPSSFAYRINQRLLTRRVQRWIATDSRSRALWTFSPVTYGLHRVAAATVYHCVDLLEEVPGYDRVAVRAGERSLAAAGVTAIASSRVVQSHLRDVGFRDVLLWENVADVEMIEAESRVVSRSWRNVAFVGNLTATKVDFALLQRLVEALPDVRLHLAGPVAEGGGAVPDLQPLLRSGRVVYHDTLRPEEMARLLGCCSVGLIPYVRNAYTAGVFPMKTYEYLAAGLAVVATALPSMRPQHHVSVCTSDDEFIRTVNLLAKRQPDVVVEERRATARAHSWSARGRDAYDLLLSALASPCGADQPLGRVTT